MRSTTVIVLSVLAALVGLSACGSKDAGPRGSGSPTENASAPGDKAGTSDICTLVTDEDMSGIVGHPVTREKVPGGGCTFNQDDVRAPSISLATTAYDEGTGGFDGAVTGLSSQFSGDAGAPVAGIGDQAYAKTGRSIGGSNTQGGGLVRVGTTLVQVTVIQGTGLPAEKVKALVVDTLTLVAAKA